MLVLLKAHANGLLFLIGSEDFLRYRDLLLLIVMLASWKNTRDTTDRRGVEMQ